MARVLLLCLCFLNRDKESAENAFVQYREFVLPQNAADEALGMCTFVVSGNGW